jgi:deoxyribonuclease-4
MAEMRIGIHLGRDHVLQEGAARGADCVQFFLGDPNGWKVPPPGPDAAELAGSDMVVYVHAPYGINLASPNNRIRIPSRKLLAETCTGAAAVGAAGVIVHGGQVTAAEDEKDGFVRWRKALDQLESEVPVLLENTAGGNHAMARRLDTLGRLGSTSATPGSGSASTPATPTPAARSWTASSTGCWRSPAASTWSRPTTPRTPPVPAATATRTSARARSASTP